MAVPGGMRMGSNRLCAVGRKRMSVEDNKAAVRRFTQALDSNDLSICLRFARRPALIRGARESTLIRGATITLI